MNLKKLLKTPLSLHLVPKWLTTSFFVVALVGFADATYLTIEHFLQSIPPCTTDGCEIVLTSSYSQIAGIPVALLGAIYYLILLVLLLAYFDGKKEVFLRSAFWLTILGLLFSIYFLIIQAFVINAFCQYCLVSAGTSTILFILGMIALKKFRKPSAEEMTCLIV